MKQESEEKWRHRRCIAMNKLASICGTRLTLNVSSSFFSFVATKSFFKSFSCLRSLALIIECVDCSCAVFHFTIHCYCRSFLILLTRKARALAVGGAASGRERRSIGLVCVCECVCQRQREMKAYSSNEMVWVLLAQNVCMRHKNIKAFAAKNLLHRVKWKKNIRMKRNESQRETHSEKRENTDRRACGGVRFNSLARSHLGRMRETRSPAWLYPERQLKITISLRRCRSIVRHKIETKAFNRGHF